MSGSDPRLALAMPREWNCDNLRILASDNCLILGYQPESGPRATVILRDGYARSLAVELVSVCGHNIGTFRKKLPPECRARIVKGYRYYCPVAAAENGKQPFINLTPLPFLATPDSQLVAALDWSFGKLQIETGIPASAAGSLIRFLCANFSIN